MGRPELLIATVAYRCDEALAGCLASVYDATRTPFEWCVVDNAPQDSDVPGVTAPYPEVRSISNTANRGFAAAVNQAFRSGPSRRFLVLNPDTVVAPGAIDAMLDYLDAAPDAGLVSCRIENDDGSLQYSIRRFPTLLTALAELCGMDIRFPGNSLSRRANGWDEDYGTTHAVDWLSGSAFLLPSEVFAAYGGLDERYFMYSEEVDLCRRLQAKGRKVWYFAEATIRHSHAVSSRQTDVRQIEYYKSLYRYFRKNHGLLEGAAIRLSLVAWQLLASLAGVVRALLRRHPGDLRQRLAPRMKLLRWASGPDHPPRWP